MSKVFDIKKLCTGYLDKLRAKNHKSAFTTAEMLIVLLIISFLVIAMQPLVSRKIQKRLRRGEHGRYECFVNPSDGHLYEYLATERGGQIWGANGHDLGEAGAEGTGRCRFRPQEMASTASYFIMQVIGGGGGGAYPPYNAGLHYQRVTDSTNKVRILRQPEPAHADGTVREYLHSGSQYFNTRLTYAHDRTDGSDFLLLPTYTTRNSSYDSTGVDSYKWGCDSNNVCEYISGTKRFKDCRTKRWVYDYFPPVVMRFIPGDGIGLTASSYYNSAGGGGIRVCSGHGIRANSTITPSMTSTTSETLDANGNPIQLISATFSPNFGHRGGFGFCVKAGQHLDNLAGEDPENDSDEKKEVWNTNIALGRDEDQFFKITTNSYINSFNRAMYYRTSFSSDELKLASFVDYLYDPMTVTSTNSAGASIGSIKHGPYTSTPDVNITYASGRISAVMCPYTGQSGKYSPAAMNKADDTSKCRLGWPMSVMNISSLDSFSNDDDVCANALDWRKIINSTTYNNCPTLGNDNWKWPNITTSGGLQGLPEMDFYNTFIRNNPNYMNNLDMGLLVEAKHYNYRTGAMEDANCNIPGGRNADNSISPTEPLSEVPDPDDDFNRNAFGDVTVEQFRAGGCNTDVWKPIPARTDINRLAGQNKWPSDEQNNFMGKKHTFPVDTWFSDSVNDTLKTGYVYNGDTQVQVPNAVFSAGAPFPTTINMSRTSSEYSTTYGFGGRPGEAVGLSYSNLTGTIEIQLGEGGAAGQTGNETNRTGGTGGNTIVWRKAVGTPDALDCSAPANEGNPSCSRMAIAQGGLGHKEGAVGRVISLRGERTCDIRNDDNSWTVNIDNCLDVGAGPRLANTRTGGNELRFAEDSNFYMVPELEQNSNTRSLLEEVYQGFNMPGSGGDGGYTFLYKIEGGSETDVNYPGDAEQITATNHTNFTPEAMRLMDAGEWFMVGSRTNFTLRTTPETTEFVGYTQEGGFDGYRCYRKNDTPRDGEHNGTGTVPTVLDARTGLCAPQRGEAGAVVIVW